MLDPLGLILDALGVSLGSSWAFWGPPWALLGPSLAIFGHLGDISYGPKVVKTLGTLLKNGKMAMPTRCHYGVFSSISASSLQVAILSRLGTILARLRGYLGPSWGHLGVILGHLGAILASSWTAEA